MDALIPLFYFDKYLQFVRKITFKIPHGFSKNNGNALIQYAEKYDKLMPAKLIDQFANKDLEVIKGGNTKKKNNLIKYCLFSDIYFLKKKKQKNVQTKNIK